MDDEIKPHPQNVDGPFYVAADCCTACGVPLSAAPGLFAWDSNDHCFVKRQPTSSAETDQMLRAVRGAELDCIRYRGLDADTLARFAELGVPYLCDLGPRVDIKPVLRNQVEFILQDGPDQNPARLAEQFRDYFLPLDPERHCVTTITASTDSASFSLAWFEDHFHSVTFAPLPEAAGWLITHQGNLGVSDVLNDWLTARGAGQVRWFADSDRHRSESWRATPW